MKEPKFPKLEDLPKDNKYDFFAEGIFPEEIEEKERLNKNRSTRKQNRFPLSIPAEAKKPANTQQDDELLPFFAKNYPPSSESKEDICFINSPVPSDTPDNTGEAEEVDVDEEEDEESENRNNKGKKKEKNNNNINNEEIGASVEFNSEMEYDYEHPSKMMTKEEIQEMVRKNQERKREEKRKKEEEERRKKEEEENKKKEEERKRKEEERKRKEEEKRRKDEEKKRKENEEKEKEKERLKKIEEEKKNKIKSSKKDPINALSSIKKNYDDNSNIASNSMINDMQNIFPIQEEKGENESDEDDTKRNFRKSSKEKYSEKKSKSKNSKKITDFNEEIEKNKNKKNPKPSTDEDEETKETDLNKKNKNNNFSRKSNGLKKEEKKEKVKSEEIISEDEEEEYSNYGDELADAVSKSKKEKVPVPKKKLKKRTKAKKMSVNNEINEVTLYHAYTNIKIRQFEYKIQNENRTFGETRKYSLRNRIPTLRHDLGERPIYYFDENGLCTLKGAELAETNTLTHTLEKAYQNTLKRKEKKKKKLVKGLNQKIDTIPEEESEFNSELLDSENISEFGEDDARILKIPKGGKKSRAKNFDTVLVIKIIEANGKNMIKVDEKEYKNLKSDNEVKVDKNQEFEILNFSNNNLVVQLLFDDNN